MQNNKKSKKIKILFVLDHFWPHIGGAEKLFYSLSQYLRSHVDKIIILTLKEGGCSSFERIDKNIEVIRIGKKSWSFIILAIFKVYFLARQVDVVHTTTYYSALPAFIGARLARKPIIITVHEIFGKLWLNFFGSFKGKIHQLIEKLLISLPFDCYVAVSNYTYNILRIYAGIYDSKIRVIYNGIDYSLWDPRRYDSRVLRKKLGLEDFFVYLYYGRPGVSKGVEYLIKAVPSIRAKIPKSRLLLILASQSSSRYRTLLKLIKELGVEKDIIIKKPLPVRELPAYIKMADCVVIPSLSEGFGFAAAECSAIGTPIVVSHVGSLPEVVSGRVVFARD